MTTITRKHLELAAKAARYAVHWGEAIEMMIRSADGIEDIWQPHIYPADAWQLAADCRLNIDFDNERVFYQDEDDMYAGIWFCKAWHCTAMEAVTLAAAEIGRAMG